MSFVRLWLGKSPSCGAAKSRVAVGVSWQIEHVWQVDVKGDRPCTVGEERAMVPKHGVLEHWLAFQPGCKTNYLEERKQYMKPREPGSPSIVNQMSAGGSREPWTAWAEGIWWPAILSLRKMVMPRRICSLTSSLISREHIAQQYSSKKLHISTHWRDPVGIVAISILQTKKPKYERHKTM